VDDFFFPRWIESEVPQPGAIAADPAAVRTLAARNAGQCFSRSKLNSSKVPALFAVKSEILASEGLFPRNQEPKA
jgi:hypothetical protein